MPPTDEVVEGQRIFRALLPFFGTVRPASFFRDTSAIVRGVQRIHPLIEGVYKPAGWVYPLSIASMLKSPYNDKVFFNSDRTWWMSYSSKKGAMDIGANAALIAAMTDHQPVLVLRQESDRGSSGGARHRLLGLGFIETFDPNTSLFRIRGLEWGEVSGLLGTDLSDDLIETALRLESLEEWVPFAAEDRAVY